MAKFTLAGGAMKDAQIALLEQQGKADAERLDQALRDIDQWRDKAHTAEQDAEDARHDADCSRHDVEALQSDLATANKEIDRLRATALPPPMDGRPIEPTTDPVQALIGEALDMEIGGAEK